MDDLSSGATDCHAAYELYLKSKLRLAEGGFNLSKFVPNCSELTDRIQCNEASISMSTISENTEHRNSTQDLTKEEVVIEEDKTYAKSVLGTAEETSGTEQKMFFQELCKAKISWDKPPEGELEKGWQTLVAGLQGISSFTLSRFYFQGITENIVTCSLRGFGDAPRKAYAAVIYLCITTTMGSYVKFVLSRSRVVPLKEETIPTLELLAALIVARLMSHVGKALEPELSIDEIACWTDSKVALAWIKGEEREWKQFVQNRVNEIRTLVLVHSWRHGHGRTNQLTFPPPPTPEQ